MQYMAPETMIDCESDIRCDNWALGVMLYMVISGKYPFLGDNKLQIGNKIINAVYSFNDESFFSASDEVKDLIGRLLTRNPCQRYTAVETYDHPWIQRQVTEGNRFIEISSQVIDRLRKYRYNGQ